MVSPVVAVIVLSLIAKAIWETTCGTLRLTGGIACLTTACTLDALAAVLGYQKPHTRRPSVGFRRLTYGDNVSGMKEIQNSIANRLAAAATKARALGLAAAKRPVASILSLCMVAGIAATIATFSQTTEPTAKPLTPMQIGIKKWADRYKQECAETLAKAPRNKTEERIQELTREIYPTRLAQIDALLEAIGNGENHYAVMERWAKEADGQLDNELAKKIREADGLDPLHIKYPIKWEAFELKIKGLRKNPEWEKYNLYPWDMLPALEIIDPKEDKGVSLAAKLDELGFVPQKQQVEDCALYATYHALQFASLQAKKKVPTLDELRAAYRGVRIGSSYDTHAVWEAIPAVAGQPITQWCKHPEGGGGVNLRDAIAKQELRNGRPVVGTSAVGTHLILIIGYHYEPNGRLIWEIQDSNTLYENKGRKETKGTIAPLYSIRFE